MSYHTDAHRGHYVFLRISNNAPVILTIKTNFGWYIEIKDTGEMMYEQLQACCAWCAKAEGIAEWVRRKEVT